MIEGGTTNDSNRVYLSMDTSSASNTQAYYYTNSWNTYSQPVKFDIVPRTISGGVADLIGTTIDNVQLRLEKVGNPVGQAEVGVWDSSNIKVHSFGNYDMSTATAVTSTITPQYDFATDPVTGTFENNGTTYSQIHVNNETWEIDVYGGSGLTAGSVGYITMPNILSDKFVIRFMNQEVGSASYSSNAHHVFYVTDTEPTTTNHLSGTDGLGIRHYYGTQFSGGLVGIEPRLVAGGSTGSHDNTYAGRLYGVPSQNSNAPLYHELSWDGSTYVYTLYSDSDYTTVLNTATLNSSTNTQWVSGVPSAQFGAKYLMYYFANDHAHGTYKSALDDLKVCDGSSTWTCVEGSTYKDVSFTSSTPYTLTAGDKL